MADGSQTNGQHDSRALTRDPLISLRSGIPSPPPGHVRRPRLLSALDGAAAQPLTLVSASAGAGKTSLVADWATGRDHRHTAWITFEDGDGHASTFWSTVCAQLRAHGVDAGAAPARHLPRSVLAEIAGTLAARATPLTLVLDGWEYTTDEVANGFDFLLRHSSGKLCVVIVTRADPVLPLHRYRLSRLMTDVRGSDLAFTFDEVRALVEASGPPLTEESVEHLTARTRGWAAGLRFAQMYLLGHPNPDEAVRQLAGNTGNIAEYLMAEVLDLQSEPDRELLLNTSVVEILRPGLIEELGGPAAPRALARLALGNAMIETIHEHPGWYRYHPFFRELLRAELHHLRPARAIALDRRAGRWFADHGSLVPAVGHAAAAYQWAEAARYVVDDLAVGQVIHGWDSEGLSACVRAMPMSVPGSAPAIIRAAVAVGRGDTTTARQQLDLAGGGEDDPALRAAQGLVASWVSLSDPDPARALEVASAAERELDSQTSDRLSAHPELGAMIRTAGATALARLGRLRKARAAFNAVADRSEAPGGTAILAYALSHLALLDAVEGELRRGRQRAERALELASTAEVDERRIAASSQVALVWVAMQQGDKENAWSRIKKLSGDNPPTAVLPAGLLELATVRLTRAGGDIGRSVETVRRLRDSAATTAPWVAELAVEEEVMAAVSGGNASAVDDLTATLSRRGDSGATLATARLRLHDRVPVEIERIRSVASREAEPLVARVAAWLLVAGSELQHGEPKRARASVQRGARLAEPERLRWPFEDAAPAVRELCARADPVSGVAHGRQAENRQRPRTGTATRAVQRQRRPARVGATEEPPPVIDTLTVKELEVLNHLSELLTTEEIADAMFVSVNTVRTHVRSILRKLSVSRRHQAVRRARALDILTAS